MLNIAIYIIIGIISFGISYILAGFVEKFTKEDEKIQEFVNKFDENDEYLQSNEFKEEYKKVKKNSKVKFKPKFSLPIAITTTICTVLLFIFREDYLSFFVKAYLILLLIISMFADIKSCIIPDEVNIIGLITGAMYVCYNYFISVKQGTELILGGLAGFGIFFLIGLLGYLIFKKEGMGGRRY